jgi:UDP-N-acetyl-D-mannosaminuronate dehydrogenase
VKKPCILGLGYIGLPTVAMSAANGQAVAGIDIDQKVTESFATVMCTLRNLG